MTARYPSWHVQGYTVYDVNEARMLAQALVDRQGKRLYIMQCDDAMSPAFLLEWVEPKGKTAKRR